MFISDKRIQPMCEESRQSSCISMDNRSVSTHSNTGSRGRLVIISDGTTDTDLNIDVNNTSAPVAFAPTHQMAEVWPDSPKQKMELKHAPLQLRNSSQRIKGELTGYGKIWQVGKLI